MAPGGNSATDSQTPVVTGATDINKGPLSCSMAQGQDLGLHDPRTDISLDSSGQRALPISPFFTTLPSPDLPFSPAYEPFCLFHLPTLYSLSPIAPNCPVPELLVRSHVAFAQSQEMARNYGLSSLPCLGLETLSSTWYGWYLITQCQGHQAGLWLTVTAPQDQKVFESAICVLPQFSFLYF